MRHINKTRPPEEFVEYCKTPGVSYEGLSGEPKKKLRKRLVEDQGYICCYCGMEISDDEHTKIEHVKCQKYHSDLALCFDNMLASCDGGESDRKSFNKAGRVERRTMQKHQEHCDAKKEEKDIPVSPLDAEIESFITYFDDGSVKGCNDSGKQLVQTLGLNARYLQMLRKNAIDSYLEIPMDDIKTEIEKLHIPNNGRLQPFCFAIEQCLYAIQKNKENELALAAS